jgi:hypothetical protein
MKIFMSGILLIIILAYEPATAVLCNGCERRRKDDSKIRIGFLSRYKSSKVSFFNMFT